MQALHVPARVLARLVEHALGDERPPAALPVHQLHSVTGSLQELHGGAPDLRSVVGDEGVVEENDGAAWSGRPLAAGREPVGEGLAGEGGQRPPTIDPRHLLHEPSVGCGARDPVRERRELGTPPRQPADVAEDAIAQRQPIGLVIVVEELVLHLGHVHVGRTLRLAALALETQIHHFIEALAREVRGGDLAREHGAQRVGPPPRGVLLVARGHVRGAHGAFELLPAHAHAVAHLHRRREAALRGKVQQGLGLPRRVLGAVAEVLGDRRARHDVARIHASLGVEGGLELAESLEDLGAEHALEEGAPGAPIAVLARDGAAVLEDEVEDLVGHVPHLLEPARRLEIDQRADVQAPDGAVAVVGALGPVLGHDVAEARHEDRQVFGIDRGVLDEGDGLGLALGAEEKPEARLAELPDRLLLGGIERHVSRVAEARLGTLGLERLDLGLDLSRRVPRVLHDEDRARIALDEAHALGLLDVVPREVEDHLVGELDRVWPRLQNRLRGLEGFLDVVVVDHVDGGGLGARHQAHLRLDDAEQRAFRADHQPRHVQRAVLHELVQVVPAHAPPVLRVAAADGLPVLVADARHLAINLAFQTGGALLCPEGLGGDLAEHHAAAVGEQRGELDDVIDGEPVRDGVRAAGVVPQHAPDGRPVRRRGVRAEEEAHGPHVRIELVLDHAGLHARPHLLAIHFEDVLHPAREVQDHRAIDRLPGERGAAAPGQHRHVLAIGELEHGLHVARVARDDHPDRLHLVHRRVGGVQQAGVLIEADVAFDDAPQFPFELGHDGDYTMRREPHCARGLPRRPPRGARSRSRRAGGPGCARAAHHGRRALRLALPHRQEGARAALPGLVVQVVREPGRRHRADLRALQGARSRAARHPGRRSREGGARLPQGPRRHVPRRPRSEPARGQSLWIQARALHRRGQQARGDRGSPRGDRGRGAPHRSHRLRPQAAGQASGPRESVLASVDSATFLRGLIIGFSIAAPVGPIGVLCMRRTLADGRAIGFASGLGAATADALYGAVAAFGLSLVTNTLVEQRLWLQIVGGIFLLYLGVRTWTAVPRDASGTAPSPGGLAAAWVSTFALTLTNPTTIISFAAIFAGLGLGRSVSGYGAASVMVLGVLLGSAIWWLFLSVGVGLLRSSLTPARLGWVNRGAGAIIAAFGVVALASLLW